MSVFSITGRLGSDSELKTMQNGKSVLQFSIAEDRGFGEKKRTIWVKCALFGDRADKLAQYLTKGSMVEAWGEISTSAFKGKDGEPRASLELRVADLKLHGGGSKDRPVADNARAPRRDDTNDEIPW